MFRTKTGEKIEDRDYRRVLRVRELEAKRAAAKEAEAEAAREDREEVAERLEDIEAEVNGSAEAFALWVENMRGEKVEDLPGTISCDTLDDMVEDFTDSFNGTWRSEKDYTENAIEEGLFGDLGDGTLALYVDVASLTRDLFISDLYSLDGTEGTHVFHNC